MRVEVVRKNFPCQVEEVVLKAKIMLLWMACYTGHARLHGTGLNALQNLIPVSRG